MRSGSVVRREKARLTRAFFMLFFFQGDTANASPEYGAQVAE
jgi:hypothetical protein